MKKVEAIIRPIKLDEVKIALGEIGVMGMSVSDVRGAGSSLSPLDSGSSKSLLRDMPIRTRIEIVARDEDVAEIVDTIEVHARTGDPGDGKIFVMPMIEAIRVRTEERGELIL